MRTLGKPLKIAIKICTPAPSESTWGDTAFAGCLAEAFERSGHQCSIHYYRDWNRPDREFDMVIVITGHFRYNPKPWNFNVLWIISHPEVRTPAEVNAFDVVCVASEPFARRMGPDLSVPCRFMPQATDPGLFTPDEQAKKDIDVLFVGNNYYHHHPRRKIISDLLESGQSIDFRVVGQDWDKGVPRDNILAEFVPWQEIPALYRRARINLNDHHATMLMNGFINNRTYDLAALKAFQISDPVEGLDKLGIETYRSPGELGEKIGYFLANEGERNRNSHIVNALTENATFTRRSEEFLEIYATYSLKIRR